VVQNQLLERNFKFLEEIDPSEASMSEFYNSPSLTRRKISFRGNEEGTHLKIDLNCSDDAKSQKSRR
jgi:hypothetical protein